MMVHEFSFIANTGRIPAQVPPTKSLYMHERTLVVSIERAVSVANLRCLLTLWPMTDSYTCTAILGEQGGVRRVVANATNTAIE